MQVAYDPTVLTSDIKPGISGNIELSGGWYVVQGHVSFTNTVIFLEDVHLILADDAVMNVATSKMWGVRVLENFTVYGQAAGSGKLEAHSEYMAICTIEDFAVIGGNIEATGDNSYDISGKNITISGGFVTAKGKYGILGSENITISGGIVTANGDGGITANGALTLGWTLETNRITAGSYDAEQGIIIAKGKKFQDGTGKIYSGAIDREQAKALAGQTLTPFTGLIVTFDSDIHTETTNISLAHQIIVVDENGHVAAPEDPTYDGYKFLGWYTTDDGDTKFDFEAPITTDMTAYAKWEVAKYTITVVGEYLTVDKTEAAEGETVTLTVDYDGDYIIMIGTKGMEFNLDDYAQLFNVQKSGNSISFDMPANNITLRLAEKVGVEIAENIPYIDENGKTNICEKAEVIQSDYVISRGGWYVVEGDVTANLIMIYSKLESIHIILKDNAKLTLAGVEDEGEVMSAYIVGGLSIYAQSTGDNAGSLIAEGGVVARNLIVNGGSIQAKATLVDAKEVRSLTAFTFTMNGGSVNANDAYIKQLTMNGGSVNANDAYIEQLTMNGGSLKVLDYTNSFDIAAGTYIADEDGIVYSGTLSKEQIATIGGKTLTPIVPKSLSDVNVAVADIPVQKYADGKPVCPSVVVTDGKDTLKAGTDYTVTCFNNTTVSSATLDEAAIAQITGKGNYAGAIQKRFFIWENIGNYAAVQVYKDKKGDSHAEIDGAYDGTDAVAFDEDITVESVVFNREFSVNLENGGFSTIMLPFEVNASNLTGVKSVFEFAEVFDKNVGVNYVWCNAIQGSIEEDKGKTNCNELSGELKAYTPYLIEMETPTLGIKGGVVLKSTTEAKPDVSNKNWVFRGVLQKKDFSKNDQAIQKGIIWAFAGSARNGASIGKFVQFGNNTWVNPFRAYLVDCTTYSDASECKDDETQPEPSFVSRYRFADVLAPATSAENSLSAKVPMRVAANETASLEGMEVVIMNGDMERPTVIGHMNPATGEIRMLPRTTQSYDLKGRRVNEGRKAKGAYYRK